MSEVELQAIYSKFELAKTEYNTLLSDINTTCLGDTLSETCSRANTLNAQMRTSLIEMSNFFKPSNTENTENQEKLLQISNELQEDKNHLMELETNKASEKDNQLIATMNYNQAMIWFFVCIRIVLLLYNQSVILFLACITIGYLLYNQLWFLACIVTGLLYCYFLN